MSDLISRQAAIEQVLAGKLSDDSFVECVEECNSMIEWAVDVLKNLPSAQPEQVIYASMSDKEFEKWLYEHGICNPNIHESIPCDAVPLLIDNAISELPSAQPERTCINCGRTANNGGWYADGGTRCPIEEHYALPKDGYCHLWEKRNVTDDDYPERREE